MTPGLGIAGAVVLLGAVTLLSLRIGSVPIDTATVWNALTGFDGSTEHLIVRDLRVPRTAVGLAVGAALAVVGVVMQAVTHNGLASPEILGVNGGAAFAIVVALFVTGPLDARGYVWFAFGGALVTTLIVVGLASSGRGGATPVKLALSGAVMAALLASWRMGLLIVDQRTLDEVRFWLAGSIAGRDLVALGQVAPFLVVGIVAAFALGRQFDLLALGDQAAMALGVRLGRIRSVALVVVVFLAGASVAVAGPIGFVGLAVPHAVRCLVGASHRRVLPYAVLLGPVLLLSADVVGRVLVRPSEIEVGIITAIVGAPVLVHLVRRHRTADR